MQKEFKKISLNCQETFAKVLSDCPERTSEYTFANILGWTDFYGLELGCGDDMVWIRETEPELKYWAPIGNWENVNWEECELLKKSGTSFTRVPEKLALMLQEKLGDSLKIEENRGHFDYIYSVQDLIDLKGNKFHKKKNLFNQFKKKYDYEYKEITPECIEEVLEMQMEWYRWQEENNYSDALEAENDAIFKVLKEIDTISNLTGGTIRIDGKIIAYTVAEALDEETIVIHFEKGDTRYKGVYQAINQMFLANNASHFKYVNREQDLGEPGLRKAKESYNPVHFKKKFEITVL
jgi:hypothetical protein